jgi:hypothetical protein
MLTNKNQYLKYYFANDKIFYDCTYNNFIFLFQIEYKYSESVTDLQLVGGQFIQKGGRGFCVTGYDNSEITFFVQN